MAPELARVIRVDTRGQTCPQPLTATTLALRQAKPGHYVEVLGDHAASFREIEILAQARGIQVLQKEGTERSWRFLLGGSS